MYQTHQLFISDPSTIYVSDPSTIYIRPMNYIYQSHQLHKFVLLLIFIPTYMYISFSFINLPAGWTVGAEYS